MEAEWSVSGSGPWLPIKCMFVCLFVYSSPSWCSDLVACHFRVFCIKTWQNDCGIIYLRGCGMVVAYLRCSSTAIEWHLLPADRGFTDTKQAWQRLPTAPFDCSRKRWTQRHWRMVSFGMLRRVALVRSDVTEELSASFITVTRIDELGTTTKKTPWPLVRERTIPTERPPLVDEI
jgi:hypothetical protein